MTHPILIVPGIGNSGPGHWQSLWQARLPRAERLQVPDWDRVACDDWVAALARHVQALGADTTIVAHSLGCLTVAHWAARYGVKIRGALLVAVPDPAAAAFPTTETSGFTPVPTQRLPFPAIVVSSTNDPYGSIGYARGCAEQWGSPLVDIGPRGHVNADSGLGDWPAGLALLEQLLSGAEPGQGSSADRRPASPI